MRGPLEDGVGERGERYLLLQEGLVCLERRFLMHVGDEDGVGGCVAVVEGEQEIDEPGVIAALLQGREDGVEEELAEVVDGVGDECGDAEVVGAAKTGVGGHVVEGNAGEVEEGRPVVRREIREGLVDEQLFSSTFTRVCVERES